MDKSIENIFKNSDKAEFLEFVNQYLPDCFRAVVLFEMRNLDTDKSDYEGLQHGFSQLYELDGFLRYTNELYLQDNEDEE